jgi:kynurenine formamidase
MHKSIKNPVMTIIKALYLKPCIFKIAYTNTVHVKKSMSMKPASIYILMVLIASCKPAVEKADPADLFAGGQWIDLTYDFSDKTIYWPNNPDGFRLDTQFKGQTDGGFYYESYAFYAPEHGGTHLDAPIHFAEGRWSADEIPVDRLTGRAVVVDVSDKCSNNADYLITTEDVLTWEKEHGQIPDDAMLIFRTGYGAYYPDAAKYLGTALKGDSGIANLHFPSIGPDLAGWLVQNRKLKAVGIDVASVDYGQSKDFKTHQILYRENIIGFENLANLDKLPANRRLCDSAAYENKGG